MGGNTALLEQHCPGNPFLVSIPAPPPPADGHEGPHKSLVTASYGLTASRIPSTSLGSGSKLVEWVPVPTITTSSCGNTPHSLPGPNPAPGLPSYGEQGHDQHRCGEAIHALLHHDAVDGQPRVVGQEGLSCRTSTGQAGSAPLHGIGTGPLSPLCQPADSPIPTTEILSHHTLYPVAHGDVALPVYFIPYCICFFLITFFTNPTQHHLKKQS